MLSSKRITKCSLKSNSEVNILVFFYFNIVDNVVYIGSVINAIVLSSSANGSIIAKIFGCLYLHKLDESLFKNSQISYFYYFRFDFINLLSNTKIETFLLDLSFFVPEYIFHKSLQPPSPTNSSEIS